MTARSVWSHSQALRLWPMNPKAIPASIHWIQDGHKESSTPPRAWITSSSLSFPLILLQDLHIGHSSLPQERVKLPTSFTALTTPMPNPPNTLLPSLPEEYSSSLEEIPPSPVKRVTKAVVKASKRPRKNKLVFCFYFYFIWFLKRPNQCNTLKRETRNRPLKHSKPH